jgi:hypothetical protein
VNDVKQTSHCHLLFNRRSISFDKTLGVNYYLILVRLKRTI